MLTSVSTFTQRHDNTFSDSDNNVIIFIWLVNSKDNDHCKYNISVVFILFTSDRVSIYLKVP